MSERPKFTFIVLVYNMVREAPRTLYTLSAQNQRGAAKIPYEVIVVENGSTSPLAARTVEGFGPQYRYVFHETKSASPVEAMDRAARMSEGEYIVMMNDGARMLSPGVLDLLMRASRAYERAVVSVPGYNLGPKNAQTTGAGGYAQEAEDRLLATVPWEQDGYRLFDIASLGRSSARGWFMPIAESNCLSMPKEIYEAVGGVCQEFQSPGGGLIAHDFFKVVWECEAATPVMLLGEGTFHQYHGGTMTNAPAEERRKRRMIMEAEYKRIRGEDYVPPTRMPHYLGCIPELAARFVGESGKRFAEAHRRSLVPGMEEMGSAPKRRWYERVLRRTN
jgi:hypothetical protein